MADPEHVATLSGLWYRWGWVPVWAVPLGEQWTLSPRTTFLRGCNFLKADTSRHFTQSETSYRRKTFTLVKSGTNITRILGHVEVEDPPAFALVGGPVHVLTLDDVLTIQKGNFYSWKIETEGDTATPHVEASEVVYSVNSWGAGGAAMTTHALTASTEYTVHGLDVFSIDFQDAFDGHPPVGSHTLRGWVELGAVIRPAEGALFTLTGTCNTYARRT